MPVIFIAEGDGSKYDAYSGTDDWHFIAELVFFVFLAFADTLHFRFMNGINLFPAVSLLEKDSFKYLKQSVVVMIIPQITLEFPN